MQLMADMQAGDVRVSSLVAIFRAAAMKERQAMTATEASDLIDKIGMEKAAGLISATFETAPIFNFKTKAKKAA